MRKLKVGGASALILLLSWSLIPALADSERHVDPRLQRHVTIHAPATPVSELLASLSSQTGIKFSADVYIRDRKVNLFAADRPVDEIMERLRQHLRCLWSVKEDKRDAPTYKLWQDQKQRETEQKLRDDAENREASEYLEKSCRARLDRYSQYADALKLSDAELRETALTDPCLVYDLTDPLSRAIVRFLAGLPQDRLSAFIEGLEDPAGSQSEIPFAELPADAQELILAKIAEALPPGQPMPKTDSVAFCYWWHIPASIVISADGMEDESVISDKDQCPEYAAQSLRENGFISEDMEKQILENRKADQAKRDQEAEDELKNAGPEPDDPALRKKVTLGLKSLKNPLSAVLEALADKSEVDLIADHFTVPPATIPSWVNEELPVYKVMHAVCKIYGQDWRKEGLYLVINDQEWYDKVPKECPKWFIDKWTLVLKDRKHFTLDDLATAACEITPEQARGSLRYNRELRDAGLMALIFDMTALRFYHSLSKSQRGMASDDGGLKWKSLTNPQRERFRKAQWSAEDEPSPPDEQLAAFGVFTVREHTDADLPALTEGQQYLKLVFRFGPTDGGADKRESLVRVLKDR
ncbi:MAG TPA: hypothetical protein VFI02_12090 [Armatimonadota bacterium]|nr:hypothetical protein [Armatimonadota bacterium]